MPVREVLRYPHPALKRAAQELGEDREDRRIAERVTGDLLDTLRAFPGCVGLAAPQVDEPVRIVVVDVSGHPKAVEPHGLLLLVNPRVVRSQGSEIAREGCLSIPDLTANVRRATTIGVEALSPAGDAVAIDARGFEARCLQHEIDHLDGILFLDRVASLTADVFPRRRGRPQPGPPAPDRGEGPPPGGA
ncbi:MAG TPA: peptide deformylase [Thermoleophilaceae bacterium]|nr:peptide deformylase [Thermoleophilaceae bacterium]